MVITKRCIRVSACLAVTALPYCVLLLFLLRQQYVRYRMREALEEGHLQTVIIQAGAGHWIKGGKEILVNGRLFDVEEKRCEEDRLVLRGMYDEAETALVKKLNEACQKKNKDDVFAFARILQLLSNVFVQTYEETSVPPNKSISLFTPPSAALPDGYRQVLFAPPQNIF